MILRQSHIAGYSFACERWGIDSERAACGWLWSWLENLVLSAVKIIPLGQTAGQQIIFSLGAFIPEVVAAAEAVAWQRTKAAEEDRTAKDALIASGMTFTPISEELRAELRARSSVVIDDLKDRIGTEIIDVVLAETDK